MDTQSTPAFQGNTAVDRVIERGGIPLTFTAVDGIAFASTKARLEPIHAKTFSPANLGPLVELFQLSQDGLLPTLETAQWIVFAQWAEFYNVLKGGNNFWICRSGRRGLFRTKTSESDERAAFRFFLAAQKAAISVSFRKRVAQQMVAALGEMVDNIHQHSRSPQTGIAAFYAEPGSFEFVVADRGIGVLQSLRESPQFSNLADHGDALELALTDGCSKHGANSNHGHGFRPLFVGLSNLNGSLRFRSGDHAITIEGKDLKNIPWTKVAKPKISGFLASISCDTKRKQ
jgi:hypothetical protein